MTQRTPSGHCQRVQKGVRPSVRLSRVRRVGRACCGSSESGSSGQVPLVALQQALGAQARAALVFLITSPCTSVPVPTCVRTAQHSCPVQFWGFPFSPWAPSPPLGQAGSLGGAFPGLREVCGETMPMEQLVLNLWALGSQPPYEVGTILLLI